MMIEGRKEGTGRKDRRKERGWIEGEEGRKGISVGL